MLKMEYIIKNKPNQNNKHKKAGPCSRPSNIFLFKILPIRYKL